MKVPRLARLILARSVRRKDRPYILAEMDEEFERVASETHLRAARRWYWREALSAILPGMMPKHRRGRHVSNSSNRVIRRALLQSTRSLRHQPLFVVSVMGTLALGVSAATAVFSLAEAVFFRPLPYRGSEELVVLSSYDLSGGLDDRDISGPDYFDIESQNRVFDGIAAYELVPVALENRDGYGVKIEVARTTPELFNMLGVELVAGRLLAESEVGPAAPKYVVVANRLATDLFGDPRTAIGATLSLDSESFLIIGVIQRSPPFDALDVDAWVPLHYGPNSLRRRAGVLRVVASLREGAGPELVQADLDRIGLALESAFPDSNLGRRYVARSLKEVLVSEFEPALAALTLAVSLLLLIAVVNSSGLLLVRHVQRKPEFAIRAALGASRRDIFVQLLFEGLLIGVGAGVLSLTAAVLLVGGATRFLDSSQFVDIQPNALTLLAGISIALAASLLATVVAAWSVKPGSLVRGRVASKHTGRTRSLLLAGQVAATTVLIVCVALLGRSLQRLVDVDPGFEYQQLVAAAIDLPSVTYPTDMRVYPRWPMMQSFYDRVVLELEAVPSVTAASVAWHHPMKRGWLTRFLPEGATEIPIGERERVNLRAISSGYLDVVGARVRAGRDVAKTDGTESDRVVLVNKSLEESFFGDAGAVGKRVQFFGEWWRVIGVVDDFKSHGLSVATRPAIFPSIKQMPSETIHLVVRGKGSVQALLDDVRDAVWRVDPQLAPYNLESLETVLTEATAGRRLLVWLFGWLGGLAMVLSAVGLIGTVTETIESRRHELGLRAALGARPQYLVGFVLRGSIAIIALGIGVGLIGALGLTRLLTGWLYQVSTTTLASYWWATGAMIGVTLLASAVPAASVLRCDPKELLRSSDR